MGCFNKLLSAKHLIDVADQKICLSCKMKSDIDLENVENGKEMFKEVTGIDVSE